MIVMIRLKVMVVKLKRDWKETLRSKVPFWLESCCLVLLVGLVLPGISIRIRLNAFLNQFSGFIE
ncbi:hypothetical protein OIU79_024174, partial [Salix purpurea]